MRVRKIGFCERGEIVRGNLKAARRDKGMTQQQVADYLGKTLVYYQKIEANERIGGFATWDALEDLFGIHQRILRQTQETHPDKAGNRAKR